MAKEAFLLKVDGRDAAEWAGIAAALAAEHDRLRLLLRDRADTYWADAAELDREGDTVMAIAYWAIASELRKLAEEFEGSPDA